jgi:hypothetical protein
MVAVLRKNPWGVVSTSICLAFASLPIVVLVFVSWELPLLLAVFFWPALFLAARDSIKQKCLPVIVSGPGFGLPRGEKDSDE